MALPAGARLGPYEILSAIGAGGMGEVYRAKDTRLDRIVAIKVLPSHLSQNPQLKQRFEREARTISSLSHPHICALHDIGHQNGTDFLVMEYLEGETLAHRLDKGALPTEQVLKYGIQIAEALDKVHRQGISKGQFTASTLASQPQPISTAHALAAPALDHVVQKCFAKDPDARWQSAHDLASELKWISESGSQPSAQKVLVAPKRINVLS